MSVRTQTGPEFFNFLKYFLDFSRFLVHAFKAPVSESLPEEGFSTAVKKPSIFSEPRFSVLRPKVFFKPVHKMIAITGPRFHCRCSGPPRGYFPNWKREKGPVPSKILLRLIHN